VDDPRDALNETHDEYIHLSTNIMLKKILLLIPAVIIILVVVAALQPADFKVMRTATISAAPATVFAQVNDFHQWKAWSPWAKMDPAMKESYEGVTAGTGAAYSWAGNSKVGEGRMTITESRASELVKIKLEFLKPFAAVNTAEFGFKPEGSQTLVTWSMTGQKSFFCKMITLFVSMDRMVGGDFEKGLSQMKTVAEGLPKA
jgi:hypothetical protein